MSLSQWADVASIIGGLAIIGGIISATVQLQQFRRQRRELATIEAARSFQEPEFAKALRVVLSLPAGLTAEELRAHGPDTEDAAVFVSLSIECVAVMCRREVIDFDVVWDLMGGVIVTCWAILKSWAADVRVEQGNAKFDEWFEWLAVQLEQRTLSPN